MSTHPPAPTQEQTTGLPGDLAVHTQLRVNTPQLVGEAEECMRVTPYGVPCGRRQK